MRIPPDKLPPLVKTGKFRSFTEIFWGFCSIRWHRAGFWKRIKGHDVWECFSARNVPTEASFLMPPDAGIFPVSTPGRNDSPSEERLPIPRNWMYMAKEITSCMTKHPIATIIGKNVRFLRKLNGFTQTELAELAGIHLRYVQAIEAGGQNPTVGVAQGLKSALDCEWKDLLEKPSRKA